MPRVVTTLVVSAGAAVREQAICARLSTLAAAPVPDAGKPMAGAPAVILEGIASGSSPLDILAPQLHLARIAPGCLCCSGNLVLRVTLNRLLRQRPGRLFIGVARSEHLDQLRSWLQSEPYDQLLTLTPDIDAQDV
ncbi:GTP-binding protein [Massilia forsythiae]|uniref:GTP-binding protein n=2 Tax=Massilia forsythiae TaxID=2728020 RepID=A0A7Z2W177_9BURK|nr:GTP-binding protein [Massilia forsythiae]